MSLYYNQFSKVLEKWPLDKGKVGRDLGEHLRNLLKKSHNANRGLTIGQLDSLERISKNIYAGKYKRIYTSTATGLTAQQCSQVLSSEFLQYLNDCGKSV